MSIEFQVSINYNIDYKPWQNITEFISNFITISYLIYLFKYKDRLLLKKHLKITRMLAYNSVKL